MKDKNKLIIYTAAVTYSLITGLSYMFGKIALKNALPFDVSAYRFTAALIAISIPILLKWIHLDFTKKKFIKILPLTIFYPLMFFGFQTYGLQYSTSSEAGIISSIIPIFTLILATLLLNEKSNLIQKICIFISVSGVIYIFLMNGATIDINNIKGITLLIISSLSFAGYTVLARVLTKDFSSLELSFTMIIVSFFCFNLVSITMHLYKGTIIDFFTPLTKNDFILAITYLGVLSTLVTSLLSNFVLSKIAASKMSVFSNLGTVISIMAGVLILKEQLYYYHIIGSSLIIAGVLGVNFLGDRSKH